MSNPCCGQGAADREREPHCWAKCGHCNPWTAVAYHIHYNGLDNIACTVIIALAFINAPCAGHPLKVPGDNLSVSPTENDFCKKGCMDRERQPPHIVKACAGIHYTGACGTPGLLQWLPSFFLSPMWSVLVSLINIALTFPTDNKMMMAGAPVMVGAPMAGGAPGAYGATQNASQPQANMVANQNASGQVRNSAAERGSARQSAAQSARR